MGSSSQAEQPHLPLWEGQGPQPVPNWHPALGFRTLLIRCLISEMFPGFRDSFMAVHGNRLVVSGGVSGLGLQGAERGVPGPAARWVAGCGGAAGPMERRPPACASLFLQPCPAGSSGKGSSLVPAPGAAPSL